MKIELHGYHPNDIGEVLDELIPQAWEMGETSLILIHGHGRNRRGPGFVHTNTGYLGITIRMLYDTARICDSGFFTALWIVARWDALPLR